jgi:hypothetical protein
MIATSLKPLPLEMLYIIKIWENLSMTLDQGDIHGSYC